jgi:hypothetical protein
MLEPWTAVGKRYSYRKDTQHMPTRHRSSYPANWTGNERKHDDEELGKG